MPETDVTKMKVSNFHINNQCTARKHVLTNPGCGFKARVEAAWVAIERQ